jgi:hypothetical protein
MTVTAWALPAPAKITAENTAKTKTARQEMLLLIAISFACLELT